MAGPLRGAQRARHLIHDHLKGTDPAVGYLNQRITALQATGGDVETVREWHPHWVSMNRVNAWPVLMVTSHHGENLGRIDFVDGDPQYRWQWIVRVWLWARGDSYEQTAERVELAASAVVDTLLGRPALGDPTDEAQVLPEPMTVSLSDIERDPKTRASIAGAYIEAVVSMAETATADPPLGTAENLTAAAQLLEDP